MKLYYDLREPKDRETILALNPNNKIPVLVDGDLVLWESHAIMQYLCDRSPGQTLMYEQRFELPVAPYGRVRALLDRVHALPAWKQTEPAW